MQVSATDRTGIRTRTSNSPGPGLGMGTSTNRSGSRGVASIMARIFDNIAILLIAFLSAPFMRSCSYMKIGIGSDHAGFPYKERIKVYLHTLGHEVRDFGTDSEAPVDYPLFIRPVAEAVARGECERGIVLGGSGNGEAIVANRVRGVRCALCWNLESARLGREHNNANVISLGERMMTIETALAIVKTWLDTPFEGGNASPA